jgi:ketosteroid isomerase-like protein
MNPRNAFVIALTSAFLLLATASISNGQADKGEAEARKQILARIADIQNAAQAFDWDKFYSYFLDNNEGVTAANGKVYLTRQEAMDAMKKGYKQLGAKTLSYQMNEPHISFLSPTIVLVTGEGSATATLDDGRVLKSHFAQSLCLISTNGEWKVFHTHSSNQPQK